jgi:8-oxo-dGTP diphosphatase
MGDGDPGFKPGGTTKWPVRRRPARLVGPVTSTWTTDPLKRRMGSGALFRDDLARVLLVKPSYKDIWEIPGGAIEPGEPPRMTCRREILEELGLHLEIGRLLVVDWRPPIDSRPDGWMFVYDGGVISAEVAATIRLHPDELIEWRFVELDALEAYVPGFFARRLRIAFECALRGQTADLEDGYIPTPTPESHVELP